MELPIPTVPELFAVVSPIPTPQELAAFVSYELPPEVEPAVGFTFPAEVDRG